MYPKHHRLRLEYNTDKYKAQTHRYFFLNFVWIEFKDLLRRNMTSIEHYLHIHII